MMNTGGFSSSSFFSEEACFSDEKPTGAKTMDHMNNYSGLNSDVILKAEGVASPSLENRVPLGSHMANGFVLRSNDMNHGRNVNVLLGRHIVGTERTGSMSLPNAADHYISAKDNLNKDSKSHLFDGDKVTFMGAQHENGLFSSSLSDLFNQNLKLSSHNAASTQSNATTVAVGSHHEEDEAFESLAELEAKTIGNLLPDDDDLLAGVTDNVVRKNNREEVEGLDLFSSSGGLELGEDACLPRNSEFSQGNSNNRVAMSVGMNSGEHSREEHPSRTLFVGNINSSIEDSEILMLFEQYGDIWKLHTACKHQGFVMISYYDIRAACNAMKILRNNLSTGSLDIHFSKENLSDKDINQGTLAVLNLDSSVSNAALHEIFSAYGEIKEIRESPHVSSHHKCVEFYDIRAAEAAFCALNRRDINGQQIKLELGQPGGPNRLFQPFLTKLEQDRTSHNLGTSFSGSRSYGDTTFRANNEVACSPLSKNGGPLTPIMGTTVSSSIANSIQSLGRVEPRNQSGIAESGHLWNSLKYELHGAPNFHPHSLPEFQDGLVSGHPFGSPNNIAANISSRLSKVDGQQFQRVNSNGHSIEMSEVFGSPANGSCLSPGRHYVWGNSHQPRPQAVMWPNSPSFVNGIGAAHPQQLHAGPQTPSHMLNAMALNNHHVRSAPSVNPPPWERRHRYIRESPEAAGFHPGSLGNLGISGNSPHPMEFVPPNIYTCAAGSGMDLPIPSQNIGMHPHHQRCVVFPARGQMHPMMGSLESPNERTRNRRNDGGSNQSDNKKQFELDLDRIMRGEDNRTTLMIKNIPNKYTSKMLLAAIDERHKGSYDFLYLPIDFKNKCNVGYAFINMTEPSLIVPFYHTFNGKKWEKFNSEKVATLAYARIQGKAALVAHFQNSSLMNEDKRCRPILFHTDGPNAGDQVPFPMGSNIRTRLGKTRSNTSDENIQSTPPQASLSWEDHSNNGDSSAGSGKDSD